MQNTQTTGGRIVTPINPSIMETREAAALFAQEERWRTPAMRWDVLLGLYMIATAPEFARDPRRDLIPAETVEHIGTLLAKSNVDVEKSIDAALDRTVTR